MVSAKSWGLLLFSLGVTSDAVPTHGNDGIVARACRARSGHACRARIRAFARVLASARHRVSKATYRISLFLVIAVQAGALPLSHGIDKVLGRRVAFFGRYLRRRSDARERRYRRTCVSGALGARMPCTYTRVCASSRQRETSSRESDLSNITAPYSTQPCGQAVADTRY